MAYVIKDGDGSTKVVDAVTEGDGKILPKSTPSDPTGVPYSEANPLPVRQPPITWSQTIVTLAPATSGPLVGANSMRRKLRWMNAGVNPVTVAPGAVSVAAGDGMNYNGAAGTGFQGGSDSFDGDMSQQAFSAISTLGTTVIVWEGQ